MRRIIHALLAVAAAGTAASGWADTLRHEYEFQLDRQALKVVLIEFSKQTGLDISFLTKNTDQSNVVVGPLKGHYTAESALSSLLEGTGLTFTRVGELKVAVTEKSSESAGSSASQVNTVNGSPHLLQLTEQGQRSYEDVRGTRRGDSDDSMSAAMVDEDMRISVLEEMLVTGTHIRGITPESSPVIVYTRKQIEQTGAGTVAEFVRKIPQNFASVDASTNQVLDNSDVVSNTGVHGSAVNLRGLGAGSTLVLLNGHRLAPAGTDGSFVDVSMIPLSAIERVEVLTDGASAIYGSDAIAGVVNFILRRDFEGAETSLRYGDSTQGGAAERRFAQLLGTSWDGGNAMLAVEVGDRQPLRADQRDYVPNTGLGGAEGLRFLYPDQDQQSAFLTLRDQLSPSVDVFADAVYGDRDFAFDTDSGFLVSRSEGGSKQYGAVIGGGYEFGAGWRAQLTSNYSQLKQGSTTTNTITGLPAPIVSEFSSKSELLSFDLNVDGPVVEVPAGALRVSFGGGARREKFDGEGAATVGASLARDVHSLYAETFVPLIGGANAQAGAHRLEISLAARYDDYEDIGSSTDPKAGILWSPVKGLNLRASYARSYRVPVLSQLADVNRFYQVFPLPDPVNGITSTLLLMSSGNAELEPERSTSVAAGIDLQPALVAGLSLSATYFQIKYRERIATPPLQGGNFFLLFAQEAALAPFIDRSPDAAEVERVFREERNLSNPFGLPPAAIQATYDGRLHNIGRTHESGVDLQGAYHIGTETAGIDFFFNGTYLFEIENQASSNADTVEFVNSVYHPMDLRLRGGVNWYFSGVASTISLNYFDHYNDDRITPVRRVGSWTTADLQFSYRTPDRGEFAAFRNLTMTLSVQNVTDRDPPLIPQLIPGSAEIGYDPTNASPLGRFVSFSLNKRW